jgi:hypothetical protein
MIGVTHFYFKHGLVKFKSECITKQIYEQTRRAYETFELNQKS